MLIVGSGLPMKFQTCPIIPPAGSVHLAGIYRHGILPGFMFYVVQFVFVGRFCH